MKIDEKNKARALRQQGVPMSEIASRLGVAKSSVSYWVRDVVLTHAQQMALHKNSYNTELVEKRRMTRIANTELKRGKIICDAIREAEHLRTEPLWCIGVALYWGEGGKTQQVVRLSNSDPEIIKIMIRFFDKYSGIKKSGYRAHVHTYAQTNENNAIQYWSKISSIPKNRFYKTYIKQSSVSLKKRKTLPYGTLQVYIHSSEFFFRLMGWIEALKRMELK